MKNGWKSNYLIATFPIALVLLGLVVGKGTTVFADGEARPCLDHYSKFTQTNGTVYTGSNDKGESCQLTSTFYDVFGASIHVQILASGSRMSQTFGTNYQYRDVKCKITDQGVLLDITRKDDEEYSTPERATLKLMALSGASGYRVEITRPGFFKTKKTNCTIR
jgi:hypothetical protein